MAQLRKNGLIRELLRPDHGMTSAQQLNDTLNSFYMTDDRGNLMKLSKSTIFELNFENQAGGST